MEPVDFPQSNLSLKGPTDAIGDLPVFSNGEVYVSLWRLSWLDRLRALLFGNLWLYVWTTNNNHPPIGMIMDKTIFIVNREKYEQLKKDQERREGPRPEV